jgi:flavodoxin
MRYAVLYESETGNTERLARQIYEAIDANDKDLVSLKAGGEIPQADFYFVGFPIHQKNCSMKIVDAFEEIEQGKIAIFATCGMKPTEKYKEKLEDALSIWLPDEGEYVGMFLCQGKTTERQKRVFYEANAQYRDKVQAMLDEGEHHPSEDDCEQAVSFARKMVRLYGDS